MVVVLARYALGAAMLTVTGCSVLPQTKLEVIQNEPFLTVDSTQVPEEWLKRSVTKRRIGEAHTIEVKRPNRVKVVLVPEDS